MHMLGIPSVMRARNTFDGPAPLDDGRVNVGWLIYRTSYGLTTYILQYISVLLFWFGKAEVRTDVSGQR